MSQLDAIHQQVLTRYMKEVRSANIANLKEIKGLLNTIFGEEHNQIAQLEINEYNDNSIRPEQYLNTLRGRTNEPHYTITLYFPEVTISNTARKSHVIKDLYVRWQMNKNLSFVNGSFKGMRTTHTAKELAADYSHSHLPGVSYDFNLFCTGSGPIRLQMTKLSSRYEPILFKIFLHTINQYVKHESLEGTPHRYMQKIGVSTPLVNFVNTPINDDRIYQKLLPWIKQNFADLSYKLSDSGIKISKTDEFEKKLAAYVEENFSLFQPFLGTVGVNGLCVYKTGPNTYTMQSTITSNPSLTTSPLLEFKGVPKYATISNDTNSTTGNFTGKYIHPGFIKPVLEKLETTLTKTAIRMQNAG